jgi:hypothetical protein
MAEEWLNVIPELPNSASLEPSHKPLLDELLRRFPPRASEMTFTNLFAWGQSHPVRLSRCGETLLLWRGPRGSGVLLSPLGPLDQKGIELGLAWAEKMGGPSQFGRLAEDVAMALARTDPQLTMTEDRDNADYVYLREDLAQLSGRHFDGKRNLVKKFWREVQAEYRPIDVELAGECSLMQDYWCDAKMCEENPHLMDENLSVKRTLEHWGDLAVLGGAFLAGGEVIGFAVGEPLTRDVAVVHYEKADGKYPGIYQALNQDFCRRALADFTYVNREQDLGVEGLRKAKLSYRPHHLEMKYVVKRP